MTFILSLLPILISGATFVGIIAFFVLITKHNAKFVDERQFVINRIAQEFGLTVTRGPYNTLTLQGTIHGIPLTIFETRRTRMLNSTNRHRRYIYTTVYRVGLNPQHVPPGLHLSREKISSKVGKMIGGQDIQLEDELFDKTFIIRSNADDDARAFFNGSLIKSHFLTLNKLASNFSVQNNTLHFESEREMVYEAPVLRERLGRLIQCSHAVSGRTHMPRAPQPASLPAAQSMPVPAPAAADTALKNTNTSW